MELGSITVDNNCSSIVVAFPLYYRPVSISIVVAVLLYDNRLVTISVAIAVPVVARPDCYANRSNTDPDLFCANRHRAANTRYGSNYHCKTNCHRMLLPL